MDEPKPTIPYHYGDLQQVLDKPSKKTLPDKTTGMIAVPALFALFIALMFAPIILQGVLRVRSGDVGAGVSMFAYSLLVVPYVALPIISIRNFIKQRRKNCR